MVDSQTIRRSFKSYFNGNPQAVARAPGRVNLIGEHTDYNDGFVLPMAIDRAVWIAFRPREDRHVVVRSHDQQSSESFDLGHLARGEGWIEYLKGVAHELQSAGYELKGWEGVIMGDVPTGAGLSSSAALELAAARSFAHVSGFEWNPPEMARLSQKAENEWVGVNCGIMDQMASAASRSGHALFLDCRTLETQHVPLPEEATVVVLDTSTRRGLVGSAYNERRAQCETAARFFNVTALRDVSVAEFEQRRDRIQDAAVMRRARHIITEDQRVLDAVNAMHCGDLAHLGVLLNVSHASLRDDFEVTNDALNRIVAAAQAQPGCYGARMTGAGFGGCAVALVRRGEEISFTEAVTATYRGNTGLEPRIYVCRPSSGASLE